jgi:hypothetical protein
MVECKINILYKNNVAGKIKRVITNFSIVDDNLNVWKDTSDK